MVSKFAVIVIALLGALVASGCPPLMIGGLAYQGYDYMKEKKEEPSAQQQRKDTERDPPSDSQPEVQ
jgi:uncharacterized membrane protein YebE (DUF533 family)